MNPKQKVLLTVAAFAVVLIVGAAAYSALGKGGGGLTTFAAPSSSASAAPAPADSSSAPASSSQTAQTEESAESAQKESVVAPDFTVYDASGETVTLTSLLGKPTIVNFWASTCPPCREEMPDFQAAYETYGEELTFVMVDGVGSMLNETQEAGAAYIEEQGFTFPVYFDNDRDAVSKFGITGFPTTYFLAADGTVVAGAQGMISAEILEKGISMILPQE